MDAGAFLNIGGGRIDGCCDGAGGRIGGLSGVDGSGFKSRLVLDPWHLRFRRRAAQQSGGMTGLLQRPDDVADMCGISGFQGDIDFR